MYKFIVSPGNNGAIVKAALESRGCWSEASEADAHELKAHLIWKQTVLPIRALLTLEQNIEKGYPAAIHNHLDNNREITTKPGLIRSLRGFYQSHEPAAHCNYHAYDTMATSFIITASCEDLEYHSLMSRYNELQTGSNTKERMPGKHCKENIWLIKPAALNQGRGIDICHTLKEIKTVLMAKISNSVWVVQKYIERPLLFKGRKFDIRVWSLATARKELYFYKHGYLRTSSFGYSTGAKDNYIHLTNNCLQKWGENYGVHEAGNTLSFDAFQVYLDREYPELQVKVAEHIIPRIKDLVIDSYLSSKKVLHGTKRKNAFELLGYDFLVDEDFRVWLLEVNTNPYLGVPNDYIKELLPIMLDDMLTLAVDPYCPPPNPRKRTHNDFELLYCEASSPAARDGQLRNMRRPFNTPIYPFSAMAQLPLYRMNVVSHASLLPGIEGEDAKSRAPVIVRDTYTTLKEILDAQLFFDVSDFSVITSRIISHLQNWELASKEQIGSALQALKLLSTSPGNSALIVFGHIPTLLGFMQSENLPTYIHVGILDALIAGCSETRLKREFVRNDILLILIPIVLTPRDEETLLPKHIQLLLALGRHPAKNFYIPGETRENNQIRDVFISQGGLTCLYMLSQESPDEAIRTEIRQHLSGEFGLADWDVEVKTITKALKVKETSATPEIRHASSSIDLNLKPQLPQKKDVSPDTSFSSKPKHIKAQFPLVLMNVQCLTRICNEIEEFCELRRGEMRQRQAEEAKKKVVDYDEQIRQREEEDRAYEDRRQKAEQEMIKRYVERKQKKVEALRKQLQEKELEDKMDEERKQALMEKIKRQEEMRKFERMKKKQEMEDIKRLEDEKQRQLEEKRRVALNEWLKVKEEQEREKRLKEKMRRERDEARRMEEMNQRRVELQVKLDEKKYRRLKIDLPKAKEPSLPAHHSLIVSSFIESIDLTRQRSGPLEKIELDTKASKLKLESSQPILQPKSQPQSRKKFKGPQDQFLFEVYGQVTQLVAGKKKKRGRRAMSKMDFVADGEAELMAEEDEGDLEENTPLLPDL